MSRKTPRSLPSLAHPVIVSLGQRVEKDEGSIPLRRPPFPDIDLNNGQGFTFSHLHWVVIKVTNASLSEEEVRGVELALVHEFCHKCLALTPFSQLRQDEMFKLYSLILTTFEEEQEKIRIPLIRNKPSNKLRKQWELIVRLEEVSKLVEEVFAVRASLIEARERGLIKRAWQLDGIRDHCKEEYGKVIDGFKKAYEDFDLVAGKIGEDATLAMIYSVFETVNPEAAFLDILAKMYTSNPSVPTNSLQRHLTKSADFIAILSYEQAYHFFSGFINWVDPDDSRYGRKAMLDIAAEIKEELNVLAQEVKHDFTKFLVGSPDAVLFSGYSDCIHPFAEVTGYGDFVRHEVYYGNYALVLEAIRQQLTQGIGLLCPFWAYSRDNSDSCCGSENRALLEKVWSCTSHNRSCNWRRMGCLAKDGRAHCNTNTLNSRR